MTQNYYKYSLLGVCGDLAGIAKGSLHESGCIDLEEKVEWLRVRINSWSYTSMAYDQKVLDLAIEALRLYESRYEP